MSKKFRLYFQYIMQIFKAEVLLLFSVLLFHDVLVGFYRPRKLMKMLSDYHLYSVFRIFFFFFFFSFFSSFCLFVGLFFSFYYAYTNISASLQKLLLYKKTFIKTFGSFDNSPSPNAENEF